MSRRPNDLDPGSDPGSTRARARTAGRRLPPGGPRPGGGMPPGGPQPVQRPGEKRPPARRRRCAGCRGSCSALDRGRVPREQPREQRARRRPTSRTRSSRRRSTTARSRASSSTSRPARSTASSPQPQDGKKEFTSSGPKDDLPAADAQGAPGAERRLQVRRPGAATSSPTSCCWVLPLVLIVGFFVWMSRRARRARWARS